VILSFQWETTSSARVTRRRPSETLINANTILGAGRIDGGAANLALINKWARSTPIPAKRWQFSLGDPNTLVNSGTLEATASGGLFISAGNTEIFNFKNDCGARQERQGWGSTHRRHEQRWCPSRRRAAGAHVDFRRDNLGAARCGTDERGGDQLPGWHHQRRQPSRSGSLVSVGNAETLQLYGTIANSGTIAVSATDLTHRPSSLAHGRGPLTGGGKVLMSFRQLGRAKAVSLP